MDVMTAAARLREEDAAHLETRRRASGRTVPSADTGTWERMKKRSKIQGRSDNVFEELGFSVGEAENLHIRAKLMSKIRAVARGMTQAEAARRFGVSQPRIND